MVIKFGGTLEYAQAPIPVDDHTFLIHRAGSNSFTIALASYSFRPV